MITFYQRCLTSNLIPTHKEKSTNFLSQQIKRPLNSLQKSINKEVCVRLKMDLEYRGKMANVDPYMNVILVDATEYNGGNPSANYGKVVIRGNNVLFIKISSGFQP